LQPEMVSYDLASSHFEGEGSEDPSLSLVIARDRREGNRQVPAKPIEKGRAWSAGKDRATASRMF
jgi:hypothetical protein